jgi:arginyl-tRNA synthetase
MKDTLENSIKEALKNLGIEAESVSLEHPGELAHGDYSTNVSLAYAKQLGKNPRALAEEIVARLNLATIVEKIEVAGPGFINFHLSKGFFAEKIKEITTAQKWGSNTVSEGKKIMVEYTQPNPFKPFHIGHLMSNAIGESLSRIVEFSGAKTVRANYQGDVGLHVGKSIYGLMQKGKPDMNLSVSDQAVYIGVCYSEASNLYDTDEAIKKEIDIINKKVYEKSDAKINELYDWGRKVTLDAFEIIYKTLGTTFDYYFFESEMGPIGIEIIKKNIPGVFTESEGAVVFKAEEYDPKLHTRVFITKQGLPTYEAKEIGLNITKFKKENPDLSITETAIEQGEYMKVVRKAIEQIDPKIAERMKHVTHGMMRVESGKMSSRKGNVITGESLLRDTNELVHTKLADRELSDEQKNTIASQVSVGAIKYAILKQAIGSSIIYDEEKSISFEGDSGPYLQYATVRVQALLEKAKKENVTPNVQIPEAWETTTLEKYLYRFPETVERAFSLLEPHHIATYLTELASTFNSFYAQQQIVDKNDVASPYRLALVEAFQKTMKNGLYLLGIQVPEKM